MGRYTGPKARVNRRLGALVYENAGAAKAFERRNYPPGMANRRKKQSNYGIALTEKQKIKHYYMMREAQLRKFFDKARRTPGNTGEQLLILCERRLDNVVRRAGFTVSRMQARQGVVHRHFQVNGKTVDRPALFVRPGDVITLRNRPNLKKTYADFVDANTSPGCDWISFDKSEMKAVVTSTPTYQDVSLPVDVGVVVAFMSR